MNRIASIALSIFIAAASASTAQNVDSTALLFDDSEVHTFNISFYIENWQDTLLHYYLDDEQYIPARIEYRGLVFDSVGVRYKGNSSFMQARNTLKKPFKFRFDKYRGKQTCFGMTRLNFSNAVKDPSFMREKLAYDILAMLMPSPRAAFAVLAVDGVMLGLYTQVEQVDKRFLARHYTSNDFNLYKASDNGAILEYRGPDDTPYRKELDLKTNEKTDDWSRLISMIDVLNNAQTDSFVERAGALLDLDIALRMNAFNMAASNFDSYTGSSRNFYLYDDKSDGRFRFIPWDVNEAFGAYTNNWNIITQDVLRTSNLDRRPAFRRLLENDSLRDTYLRYLRQLALGPLSHDSLSLRIQRWKSLIDVWVQRDANKLYSYQHFLDNIDRDVVVGINMTIPGLLRMGKQRSDQILAQVDAYHGRPLHPLVPENPILLLELYPNPVAGISRLRIHTVQNGRLQLVVRDLLGRAILDIDLGPRNGGLHDIGLPLSGLSPGVYLYSVSLAGETAQVYTTIGRTFLVLR